jgi:hypothetical protein
MNQDDEASSTTSWTCGDGPPLWTPCQPLRSRAHPDDRLTSACEFIGFATFSVIYVANGGTVRAPIMCLLPTLILGCPFASAQWTQMNGPYGGHVPALAVSGTNLFAGTFRRGVFRSTNNGTNWGEVNAGLGNRDITCFAVVDVNLFAGPAGQGIFLSTNNGTSWTAVNSGLTTLEICHRAVSGTDLFVGTNNHGVFCSTDNGTTWNPADSGLENRDVNSLEAGGTNLFAPTSWGGVLLSTNYGTTWVR